MFRCALDVKTFCAESDASMSAASLREKVFSAMMKPAPHIPIIKPASQRCAIVASKLLCGRSDRCLSFLRCCFLPDECSRYNAKVGGQVTSAFELQAFVNYGTHGNCDQRSKTAYLHQTPAVVRVRCFYLTGNGINSFAYCDVFTEISCKNRLDSVVDFFSVLTGRRSVVRVKMLNFSRHNKGPSSREKRLFY